MMHFIAQSMMDAIDTNWADQFDVASNIKKCRESRRFLFTDKDLKANIDEDSRAFLL